MVEGIALLRAQRGPGSVTFDEVADHMFDYCDLHPDEAATIQRFAAFLTAVEYVPHDHNAHPDRGLPATLALSTR
jgi:hypothetical protein